MGLLLKPSIEIDKIEIQVDTNQEDVNSTTRTWGPTFPIIKINDYILASGELLDFTLTIRLNSLPSFSFEIDDMDYAVRRTLKKQDIDKCVIFVGYKNWYIKFNGLITSTNSDYGDTNLICNGILYNENLYKSEQILFKQKTYQDIIKEICQKTKMGLYTDDNKFLSKESELLINPNLNYYDLIEYIITKNTQCFWCYDLFYYLHVCNFENLLNKPYDKYSLNQLGEIISERDIILTSDPNYIDENINKDPKKLKINYYSINTNTGKIIINTHDKYFINQKEIPTKEFDFVLNKKYENIFSKFENYFQPFYKDLINKSIKGNSITLNMKNILFEITPFSVINVELFLPKNLRNENQNEIQLDEEHSGKKIVIGYSYIWTKYEDSDFPTLSQNIEII